MSGALNAGDRQGFIGEISLGRPATAKENVRGAGSMVGHLFITLPAQTTLTKKVGVVSGNLSERTSEGEGESISPKGASFELTEAHLSGSSGGEDRAVHDLIKNILLDPQSDLSRDVLQALSTREGLSHDIRASIFSHPNFNICCESADDLIALMNLIKNPNITEVQRKDISEAIEEVYEPEIFQKALELLTDNPLGLNDEQIRGLLLDIIEGDYFVDEYLGKVDWITANQLEKMFDFAIDCNDFKSDDVILISKALAKKDEITDNQIKKMFDFAMDGKAGLSSMDKVRILESLSKKNSLTADQRNKIFDFTINHKAISTNNWILRTLSSLTKNGKLTPVQINRIFDIAIFGLLKSNGRARITVLGALATNAELDLDQLEEIFKIATNARAEGFSDSGGVEILKALDKNGKRIHDLVKKGGLTNEQVEKIFDFITNPNSKLGGTYRKDIFQFLAKDGRRIPDLIKKGILNSAQINKIFDLAKNDKTEPLSLHTLEIFAALAANNKLNAGNLNEIFDLVTNDKAEPSSSRRLEVFTALATNYKLNADNLNKIFRHAKNNKTEPLSLHTLEIFAALANNNKLKAGNLNEIFDLVTNDKAKPPSQQILKVIMALAVNDKLNADNLNEIFYIVINNKEDPLSAQRLDFFVDIAANHKLNAENLNEILGLVVNNPLKLEEGDIRKILISLVTNESLEPKHYGEILNLVINNPLKPYKFYTDEILIGIARYGHIDEVQYQEIIEFTIDDGSVFNKFKRAEILQALYQNKKISIEIPKKLHTTNVIRAPSVHLRRIYHLLSDRIKKGGVQEVSLEGLQGMGGVTHIYIFINLLKKLSTSNTSQGARLNGLLEYMGNIEKISRKAPVVFCANSEQVALDLNKLIEGLKPGEGIPLPLGTLNHAIVYEINRSEDGKSYSFATINTGQGAEAEGCSGSDKRCIKYLELTLEEACEAIKEAVDLRWSVGRYNRKDDSIFIDASSVSQRKSTVLFNESIRNMFSGKKKDIQIIPGQIRGTCTWSSLDRWFERYCAQREGLDGVYEEFARLAAEDALNTTRTILQERDIYVIDVNTEGQANLDKKGALPGFVRQAIIINREARKVLGMWKSDQSYQYRQQIDHP